MRTRLFIYNSHNSSSSNKIDEINRLISLTGIRSVYLSFGIALMICAVMSMNDITAPSISEGKKNIWIAKTLPVDTWQILRAKLKLHNIITITPYGYM